MSCWPLDVPWSAMSTMDCVKGDCTSASVLMGTLEEVNCKTCVMKRSRVEAKPWLCRARRCKPLGSRGVSSATSRACSQVPLRAQLQSCHAKTCVVACTSEGIQHDYNMCIHDPQNMLNLCLHLERSLVKLHLLHFAGQIKA